MSLTILIAIFQVKLGYLVFIGAKDNRDDGDNWSCMTSKAAIKSSPPTNQHPTLLSVYTICVVS